MRGVPRERRAISIEPSFVIGMLRISEERRTITVSDSVS